MDSEEDNNAQKIKQHYEEWLQRANEIKDKIPEVVQSYANASWRADHAYQVMLSRSPEMAREYNGLWANELARLKVTFPLPPKYPVTTATSTSAGTAMGNVEAVMGLVSLRDDRKFEADFEIQDALADYRALQEQYGKATQAKQRLAELFPNLESLFQTAIDACDVAIADSGESSNAALAMRNLLEKLLGELWDKARKFEQKVDWDLIATRLGGDDAERLGGQGYIHKFLHGVLTNIAKQRPTGQKLEDVRLQFVDHVYAVAGFVLAGSRSDDEKR